MEAEIIQTENSEPAVEQYEIQLAIEYFRNENIRQKNILGAKAEFDRGYISRTLAIKILQKQL